MLTRAASRALQRYVSQHVSHAFQIHSTHCLESLKGHANKWSLSLPEEVLLEIFDCYGQTFQNDSHDERIWNSNQGWFKLVHVCREWRRIVLASPSCLRIRLLMTAQRTPRSIALKSLPLLPIIVDYRREYLTIKIQNRIASALAYPDRVCGIAITMFDTSSRKCSKLLAAMNQPFPALESLELHYTHISELANSLSSPPFLTAPTPHLRRLKFTGSLSMLLCNILSCTTSLVDLTLSLYHVVDSSLEIQLLAHLQDMAFLCRLDLEMTTVIFAEPPLRNKDVLLPKLTFLRLTGLIAQVEAFFAVLAAPSLRELHITPYYLPFDSESLTICLPKFIRNVGKPFFSAQLNRSRAGINLVLSTYSHSTDDPPFIIIVNPTPPIYLMDDVFSAILATVQVVFVVSPFVAVMPCMKVRSSWPSFFKLFRNAKTLRVSHGMEQEIGYILRPDNEGSSLQLLPTLEEIELDTTTRPGTRTRIDEDELGPMVGPFKPFMDARQQAGRPVNLHWNTDWVLLKYF
jgi:hypothetical protein